MARGQGPASPRQAPVSPRQIESASPRSTHQEVPRKTYASPGLPEERPRQASSNLSAASTSSVSSTPIADAMAKEAAKSPRKQEVVKQAEDLSSNKKLPDFMKYFNVSGKYLSISS